MAPNGEAGPILGSELGCIRGGMRSGEIQRPECLLPCGEVIEVFGMLDKEFKLFCEGLGVRKSPTSAAI